MAGYNGTVDFMGEQVEVEGGVAEIDGDQYFISDNGDLVVDKDRNIFGYIENNMFKPLDEAHLNNIKEKGYLEWVSSKNSEKPSNVLQR